MDAEMLQQAQDADGVLAHLQVAFDAGVQALARACLDGGRLSPAALDERQVASFEIAWAGAELLAARTGLAALTPDSTQLQRRLAGVFAVE